MEMIPSRPQTDPLAHLYAGPSRHQNPKSQPRFPTDVQQRLPPEPLLHLDPAPQVSAIDRHELEMLGSNPQHYRALRQSDRELIRAQRRALG